MNGLLHIIDGAGLKKKQKKTKKTPSEYMYGIIIKQ